MRSVLGFSLNPGTFGSALWRLYFRSGLPSNPAITGWSLWRLFRYKCCPYPTVSGWRLLHAGCPCRRDPDILAGACDLCAWVQRPALGPAVAIDVAVPR